MKNFIIQSFLILFNAGFSIAQIPNNIETEAGEEGKSLWNSTSAIIFAVVIILLLIVGRTWSKKVHEKRDEVSKKDKEKE